MILTKRQVAALFSLPLYPNFSPSWHWEPHVSRRGYHQMLDAGLIDTAWTWLDRTRPSVTCTAIGQRARELGRT